jgi:hypothetical protein
MIDSYPCLYYPQYWRAWHNFGIDRLSDDKINDGVAFARKKLTDLFIVENAHPRVLALWEMYDKASTPAEIRSLLKDFLIEEQHLAYDELYKRFVKLQDLAQQYAKNVMEV